MAAKPNVQKYIFLELTAWEIWITKPVLFMTSFFSGSKSLMKGMKLLIAECKNTFLCSEQTNMEKVIEIFETYAIPEGIEIPAEGIKIPFSWNFIIIDILI